MSDREYYKEVRQYLQNRGWETRLNELREGTYIIGSVRDRTDKMLVMVVEEPEEEVSTGHLNHLINVSDKKDIDKIFLTSTVDITNRSREFAGERSIEILPPKVIRSEISDHGLEVDNDEISMPDSNEEIENDSEKGGVNKRANYIVKNALGSSITTELLLNPEKNGDSGGLLADSPLIEYLRENECPQYVFWSDLKAFSGPGWELKPDSDYQALCSISEDRILLLIGTDGGDQVISIPYNTVNDVTSSAGFLKHRLTIETDDGDYDVYIATESVDSEDEVEDADEFITEQIKKSTGNGSITHNISPNAVNDDTDSDNSSGLIGSIIVWGGILILGLWFFGSFGGGEGTSDPAEKIDQPADELILTLDDMPSGWQGGVKESNDTFAKATFGKSDGYSSDVLLVELKTYNSIDDAKQAYEENKSDITDQYSVSESNIGHESIVWEARDGAAVFFRESEVTVLVSYGGRSSFDPKGNAKDFAKRVIDNFD